MDLICIGLKVKLQAIGLIGYFQETLDLGPQF